MFWRDDINAESGPHKVLLKRGEFFDESRNNREVPYKIYYPDLEPTQSAPTIIWSHGFGGNRDGAAFLSRFVASFGYVLVHITHRGTDSSLWEGKPGHPWDILRKTDVPRSVTLDRFYDVPFALAELKNTPELKALIDFDRIGISGHSFGALTTQVMSGQLFPDVNDDLHSLKENSFKAGIVYSPVPIDHLIDDVDASDIYGPIDIPLLHMTGTEDKSPIKGFDYEHRLVIHDHTDHPDKYILIKEGGDHMVYNGTRGKLDANPLRETHEDLIKMVSLAFWDAYLKSDENAKSWLTKGGATAYIGEKAILKAQNT